MDYFSLKENEIFLVSAKALIINEDGKLLILRLSTEGNWNGKWDLPGGLVEMSEDIERALQREVLEETGLKIKVGKIASVGDRKYDNWKLKDGRIVDARIILLGYMCDLASRELRLSAEHDKYYWATKRRLRNLTLSPACKEIVLNYLE